MRNVPRIVIAGTASGVGKTTFALGLIAALRGRGLRVQPFKCGPDYLDPTYHALAAGVPCRNLDTWMLPPAAMRELFARATAGCDLAVVEGVMGLHDGRGGARDVGSTAEIAKLLDAPVLVVLDVGKLSRSAGALALGYAAFDPDVRVAGFLLNQVGTDRHRRWVAEGVAERTDLPVLGYLPKQARITLPGRHLGLVPATEHGAGAPALDAIRAQIAATADLDAVLALARAAGPLAPVRPELFPSVVSGDRVRIGIARDAAFGFYYEDNLDLLRAWGAHLVEVSPLADQALPRDLDGLYLGGGFPELHAAALAANAAFRRGVVEAARSGLPIYAECGGLMYLAERLVDLQGTCHEMAGIVPGISVMQRARVRMGYVKAMTLKASLLAPVGVPIRGHEFHWSSMDPPDAQWAAYRVDGGRLEGVIGGSVGNVLASYLHVHFGSDPSLAPRFVDACRAWRIAEVPR